MEKVVIVAQMLIRKPAREVFEAFIDPTITTKFWFTKSSGKLEEGKTVTWEWEMYNVSNEVSVKEIIVDKKIATQWGQPATNVDYEFTAVSADSTYVEIKSYGFNLDTDELIKAVMDNTGGFTTVLDGAKAYLEHGIQLNLVGDKFPHR